MFAFIIPRRLLSWVCSSRSFRLKCGCGIVDPVVACGYPETREHFYPPLNRHGTYDAETYHEYFVKYDIKVRSCLIWTIAGTKQLTVLDLKKDTASKLKLEGIDSSYDLILHGIDIYEPKDDPTKVLPSEQIHLNLEAKVDKSRSTSSR